MISETFPEAGTTTYTFDDNGNVLTRTDARGIVSTSTYDALNRVTATSYSDGTPSASFAYDETSSSLISSITYSKGKMTSAWTSDAIGYSWNYDIIGQPIQLIASVDGILYPVDYYYMASAVSGITYPSGFQIGLSRDGSHRITSIQKATQQGPSIVAQYHYDAPNGALTSIALPNGISQNYGYDLFGRLAGVNIYKTGTQGRSWDYSRSWYIGYHGQSNHVSAIWEYVGNWGSGEQLSRYSYAHDNLWRLTSVTHEIPLTNPPDGTFDTDQINTFSYDQFGNMLSNQLQFPDNPSLDRETTFNVNSQNNRLNSYTDSQGTKSTSYDLAGNMISEGTKSYAYDGAGRMRTVNSTDGVYRYDALGRRVKKTYSYQNTSGTVSGSIISIYGVRNELLADYTTESGPGGSNNFRTDYIVDDANAIAKVTTPSGGASTTTILYRNHLNQVIDPSTYTMANGEASLIGQPFGSGGDNQFQGHKDDPESGLHYNLARSYDPCISRWPSPDPVCGNKYDPQSLNKYSYVRNDPGSFMDPDGRDIVCLNGDLVCVVNVWTAFPLLSMGGGGGGARRGPGYAPILDAAEGLNLSRNPIIADEAYRKSILTSAIKKANSKLSDKCNKFLNTVLDNLSKGMDDESRSHYTIDKLIVAINKADYNLHGNNSGVKVGDKSIGDILTGNSDLLAQTIHGTNHVYLSDTFFGIYNGASLLLHEAFHEGIFDSNNNWSGGLRASDTEIAKAANVYKSDKSASKDFQNEIQKNCP
jgi:RHS repeat-associated protein